MGLGGISVWQLLILLLIVVLLFGTKRLRSLGSDLGTAFRDFRKGLSSDDDSGDDASEPERLEADEDQPEGGRKVKQETGERGESGRH